MFLFIITVIVFDVIIIILNYIFRKSQKAQTIIGCIIYAKINLNSSHIFDIYDERIEMTSIMQKLFDSISKGIENTRIDVMNDINKVK